MASTKAGDLWIRLGKGDRIMEEDLRRSKTGNPDLKILMIFFKKTKNQT